ncbi:LOW QUALITY PROTEIN: uncharacterized protein ACNS7B_009773 [Menidia menidia]
MNRTQGSSPAQRQHLGAAGLLLLSVATTAPCCLFLLLNGTMLVSLRSRSAFRASPRYLLLCTLLLADTLQLAHSQALFLLSACGLRLPLALCAALTALNLLPHVCSPLTLVLMCVERYVAVCWPLRHAAVVTVRNTELSVCVLWTCGSLHSLALLGLALRGGRVPHADVGLLRPEQRVRGRRSVDVRPRLNLRPVLSGRRRRLLLLPGHQQGGPVCLLGPGLLGPGLLGPGLLGPGLLGPGLLGPEGLQDPAAAHAAAGPGRVRAGARPAARRRRRPPRPAAGGERPDCSLHGPHHLPKCLSPLIYGLRDQTLRPVLMLHLRWGCRRLSVVRT